MRQRIPRTSQMIDLEMDQQGQNYLQREPSVMLPGTSNFPQPNIHSLVTASGNASNPEAHYLPDPYDGSLLHGLNQYSSVQHHHNLGLSTAGAGNYYYSYVTPSSNNGLLPAPHNHNVSEQLPSSSNYGVVQNSSDGYGRNSYFVEEVSDPRKRKIMEGIPGSVQHLNGLASSSSSVHSNSMHPDEVAMVDASSFSLSQNRWNGPRSSVRAGSGGTRRDSLLAPDHNHSNLGNNRGQHLQPANSTFWLDQRLQANCGNGNASSWNQPSTAPFMHGTNNTNGGLLETMNLGVHRYHETPGNRSSRNVQHPPVTQGHHIHNHPSAIVQRIRGQNFQFYPQVAAASYGFPLNSSYSTVNPPHSLEIGRRQPGPIAPTSGHAAHRIPRATAAVDTTTRHHTIPHLRFLQADEVALLEIPDFYEVGNFVDHHRDMRLDIEDMSYEELLALGERIGNVSTGLTEEIIRSQLKTRSYMSSAIIVDVEDGSSMDQDADYCIICQDHYQNREKIGMLDCGHEYHANCLKKWLIVKNVCPICKSEALVTERKEELEQQGIV